jgi:hypothetical protein
VQTAFDTEHVLIVAHAITLDAGDTRSLEPMAEAARAALGAGGRLNIIADAGYSNGEQASRCEEKDMVPHVPVKRSINNQGVGTLFDRSAFTYQPDTDTLVCPDGKTLARKQLKLKHRAICYQAQAKDCAGCPRKAACTTAPQRMVTRHLHDDALNRMQQRVTPALMRLRRSTVEHPFGTLKYHIFGHPRMLLRGLRGADRPRRDELQPQAHGQSAWRTEPLRSTAERMT